MTHPTAAHPAVAPVGFWDRLAIMVLGLAGCALSYDALQQMAVAIHVRGLLTYLFPLVVDGFIAYGVRALLVLSEAPLRARLYVWVLFGTATAASIWANALHAVRLNQQTTHSGLRLSDTVVAILSTLAPLALAGAVHLYILITRYHPADPTAVRLEEKRPADHEHGPAEGAGPASAGQGAPADQMPDREHPRTTDDSARTTDQPADSTPADHDATAPDQQTNPAPDHDTDHDAPAADQPADQPADQQISAGPQADSEGRTSNGAGQAAPSAHGPADHVWVDHEHGPAEGAGPASAGQGAPADQMPDREHPQTTDDSARTTDQPADSTPADRDTTAPDQQTNPAPDHDTDHDAPAADQPADQPAGPGEGGSSGGPQGARTTSHDALAPGPRTKPVDQDEVPWEAKVAVARKAALAEGRMTRRAIRPHLRNANITVSNELFSDLQAALYADPALAHLPRDTRRAR